MQSVIVSVKLQGQEREYDLEVPAGVPARKLAELITHNIDPHASVIDGLTVRCLKPGAIRLLPPDESLAGAGLWDGVLLEIGHEGTPSDPTWVGILIGWDPLRPAEPIKAAPAVPSNAKPARLTPKARPANSPFDDVEWLSLVDATQTAPQTPDDQSSDETDDGWKPAR